MAIAQTTATEIYGRVIDAGNKDPLGYVNVRLYGGVPRAIMTDPKGEYRIRTTEKVDSIVFSMLGYRTRTIPLKRGGIQELNITMGSDELKLVEVTVKAGKKRKRVIDTTANYVFYQVLKHKDENRANSFTNYKYENYDRFQISLLNPGPKFQNFFLWRPFSFAFANKDTTEGGV
ncbi:MAG TPA: carboxypeptidase-like regulatory domain-containing protein, partial [Chitinophagales bacterium]|nr:carboxypeptidase-like regulatory domain-containing protein [Chitinophagales bacterium]